MRDKHNPAASESNFPCIYSKVQNKQCPGCFAFCVSHVKLLRWSIVNGMGNDWFIVVGSHQVPASIGLTWMVVLDNWVKMSPWIESWDLLSQLVKFFVSHRLFAIYDIYIMYHAITSLLSCTLVLALAVLIFSTMEIQGRQLYCSSFTFIRI
jgi:hypothetical protein